MAVGRQNHRQSVPVVRPDDELVVWILLGEVEQHDLKVEVVLAEHPHVLLHHGESGLVSAMLEGLSDFGVVAAGCKYEPFLVPKKKIVVYAGLVIETPRPRGGGEIH